MGEEILKLAGLTEGLMERFAIGEDLSRVNVPLRCDVLVFNTAFCDL